MIQYFAFEELVLIFMLLMYCSMLILIFIKTILQAQIIEYADTESKTVCQTVPFNRRIMRSPIKGYQSWSLRCPTLISPLQYNMFLHFSLKFWGPPPPQQLNYTPEAPFFSGYNWAIFTGQHFWEDKNSIISLWRTNKELDFSCH